MLVLNTRALPHPHIHSRPLSIGPLGNVKRGPSIEDWRLEDTTHRAREPSGVENSHSLGNHTATQGEFSAVTVKPRVPTRTKRRTRMRTPPRALSNLGSDQRVTSPRRTIGESASIPSRTADVHAVDSARPWISKLSGHGRSIEATHFHLYKRTKHVLTEAPRVLQVRELCLSSSSSPPTTSPTPPSEALLTRLGTLLTRSHTSCTTLYACSHPRLDTLTSLCLSLGAYGSRLTGAGWGECCISLVREESEDGVREFVRGLREGYEEYRGLSEEAFGEAVFVTRPGSGAF
ncbi:GHMP kinase, partial [Irpex lacteus]